MTTQENKADILAELWLNYRDDQNFEDFIAYNDLGLPLAYAVSVGIVKSTEMADKFIDETFDVLLASLEVEDTGFEVLDDVFLASNV
jgi:hypothetical protein